MLKLKHLRGALAYEAMLERAAWKAKNHTPSVDGWRTCEFCGCETNARLRACCDKGRDADRKTPNDIGCAAGGSPSERTAS